MVRTRGHVIIVGASLGGLFCASQLARNGVDVTLYDQLNGLDSTPTRTLIITPELQRVWPDFSPKLVRNRISMFRIWTDHRCLEVPIKEPDLVVERRELVAELATRALQAGARIRWGTQLISVATENGKLSLSFLNKDTGVSFEEKTDTLIAADGVHSLVASSFDSNDWPNVPILQARVDASEAFNPSVVDTWFVPERTPYFYWQIPDSAHSAAVGFVARDTRSARREFFSFLKGLGYEAFTIEAARVPLYRPFRKPFRKVGNSRVYLVGDAAAQVKVTTVGGTVTGLAGAAAAVRSILNATDYWSELRTLRRELNIHYLIRKAMDQFETEDYVLLVRSLNKKVLDVLHRTNRDRFATAFLRVLVNQPRLAVLGARALLKAVRNETGV